MKMIKFSSAVLFILLLAGCQSFKTVGLYDISAETDNTRRINNFYSLNIFTDQITNDLWFSQEAECLEVQAERSESYTGDGAISIEWNKQAGNCTWIGMGIGWDNWTGKDMSSVLNSAALSFWAKMKKGQSSGLPWAVGFEDFSGNQAWTGVTTGCVVGGTVKDSWTQIIIPLQNFPFEGRNVDMTSIKQVIFQFESSGKVWVDDISIIPFTPRPTMEAAIKMIHAPHIDGIMGIGEWNVNVIEVGSARIRMCYDEKNIYLFSEVEDSSPLMNDKTGQDIWNGDAIELAFSSFSEADPKRKIYYSTDHHIGLQMGSKSACYNWSSGATITGAVIRQIKSVNGYVCEASIPWSELGGISWETGKTYGLELAVDYSDDNGTRKEQIRWNSSSVEGFNFNPSLWGRLRIEH